MSLVLSHPLTRFARRALLAAFGALLLALAVFIFYRAAYPDRYEGYIARYANEYSLPIELIYGVIYTESGFDRLAVSSAGARGLMQITQDTYEWAKMRMGEDNTSYDDLFDAEINIRYGCMILRLLIDQFGDIATALCAYHAGAGNVKNWLTMEQYSADGKTVSKIPYRNTHWYVDKVMSTQRIYSRIYRFGV